MTFTCSWCEDSMSRAWQIPPGAGADKAWVCKECHSCYFDDSCNHLKRQQSRVIQFALSAFSFLALISIYLYSDTYYAQMEDVRMKFGDDKIAKVRSDNEAHRYKVDAKFEVLVSKTHLHTWNAGEEWTRLAIEHDFVDAAEVAREKDASDEDVVYVTYWYTTHETVSFDFEIESQSGMNRSQFTKSQIREWVEEHIEEGELEEITGVDYFTVTESRIAMFAG